LKRILILTAGFGEGHNAAARGLRDGLAQIASTEATVEVRDLFAETYGLLNEWTRRSYLQVINRVPQLWSSLYDWLDQKKSFTANFRILYNVKKTLIRLLDVFRPHVVVSVFPAYPYLLDKILGPAGNESPCQRVIVVTDSITVNAIWYRCSADYFLVPNEESATVLRDAGVRSEIIKNFGFPVSPKFAAGKFAPEPSQKSDRKVLYMINAGWASAVELTRRLVELPGINLTVTTGRSEKLGAAINRLRSTAAKDFAVIGWTNELPALLQSSHLLISKAGGATVQEAIAAGCPMIINQIVPGQEEGNAQLMVRTGSGVIAASPESTIGEVRRIFAGEAQVWRTMAAHIRRLSRPAASLEIARFLMSL